MYARGVVYIIIIQWSWTTYTFLVYDKKPRYLYRFARKLFRPHPLHVLHYMPRLINLILQLACMMARAIVFLVWTLLSFTCSFSQNEWESWKQLNGKKYIDDVEESNRFMIWKSNREYINHHNSEERSYVLKLNEFADLVRTYSLLVHQND